MSKNKNSLITPERVIATGLATAIGALALMHGNAKRAWNLDSHLSKTPVEHVQPKSR